MNLVKIDSSGPESAMRPVIASALIATLAAMAGISNAQTYPAKAVRVIVPYSAGGPLDDVMRVVGHRLTEMWGQSVIIDNRTGAGGRTRAENRVPACGM